MKFHLYAPCILESEPLDGKYSRMRIYRYSLKDSKDLSSMYYKLYGVGRDLVLTELARCWTLKEAMEMAENFV